MKTLTEIADLKTGGARVDDAIHLPEPLQKGVADDHADDPLLARCQVLDSEDTPVRLRDLVGDKKPPG